MAYGLKYTATFDSFKGNSYTLNIKKKDYTGDPITMLLAGQPVKMNWNVDEMKPGIKGKELIINIINEGTLPITSFLSVEDDEFQAELLWGSQSLFIGYLVQDDFSEVMDDFNHIITLKATDNLGLLKDVPLGDAAITYGTPDIYTSRTIEQTGTNKLKIIGLYGGMSNRMIVRVESGTALDGSYGVLTWYQFVSTTIAPSYLEITFETEMNGTVPGVMTGDITFITPVDLSARMYLSDLLGLCLKASNIPLEIRVFLTLTAEGSPNNRLFDNVMITPESFLSGGRWDDCFKVIEDILTRFHATLIQSDGYWNIVRWGELRDSADEIPGVVYDSDFVYDRSENLVNFFRIGIGERSFAEAGIQYTAIRPNRFVKETMMYRNPANLIKNLDFNEVGGVLSVSTVGTDTITDYEMTGWELGYEWSTGGGGYVGSSATRMIRVITDPNGVEKDRFGVIKGIPGWDQYACAQSNGVEVVPGDVVKLSFDVKTNISQGGPGNLYFRFNLLTTANPIPRSVNNRYLNQLGQWTDSSTPTPPGRLYNLQIPGGDNSNTYHTVTVTSDPVPTAGLFILKLAQATATNSSTNETHYKNMRFEVIRSVGGSSKAIGHRHTDSQLPNIKNIQEVDIQVDNTPSNSIAGTLFLPTFTGPVQDRTQRWAYKANFWDRLGMITTAEELFWKRKTRIKLEGTIKGLVQVTTHISVLTTVLYTLFTTKRFIFGTLSIDFKADLCDCTLYENYETDEVDADLVDYYDFTYIFEK